MTELNKTDPEVVVEDEAAKVALAKALYSMNEGDIFESGHILGMFDEKVVWRCFENIEVDDDQPKTRRLTLHAYIFDVMLASRLVWVSDGFKMEWQP